MCVMRRIGIVDADLLDGGTRHPNLVCLKLAGWYRSNGDAVELIDNWEKILSQSMEYDHIFIAKVFDFTRIPEIVLAYPNVSYGGTGFKDSFIAFPAGGNNAPAETVERPGVIMTLPNEIEHHMPYYHLYDGFVKAEIDRGIKPIKYKDYRDFSIGFATRGCFRQCAFCVNENSRGVRFHSHIKEWMDPSRRMIYLWDDNILAFNYDPDYPNYNWRNVFEELAETGKRFQFRQGMDVRLMTDEKAEVLSKAHYYGDYIFAFDHPEEREQIERGLNCWREHNHKIPKLYVLVGWDSQDQNDIESAFMRIEVLMKHRALPYIMRHEFYKKSKYRGTYINLARWCNQPSFFKKKSYREYCLANGENSSTVRYMREFEHDWPEIAKRYYDIRWDMFNP